MRGGGEVMTVSVGIFLVCMLERDHKINPCTVAVRLLSSWKLSKVTNCVLIERPQ